jgi:16S rRNA (cytosine967-C5)-methyltransferase
LADRALDVTLRQKKALFSHERREVADRIYALLRRQITVDFFLAQVFPSFASLGTTEKNVLRIAGARVLEGTPVREAARAARLSVSEASGLQSFEQACKEAESWDLRRKLWIGASLPEFLVEKLLTELGDEAQVAADAMNQRAPLTIRVNALKTTRDQLGALLQRESVPTRPTPLSALGLFVESRPNVFGLEAFRSGLFEIQDEGSQLLGTLVDAPPKVVVDACAGMGGKTLQLAAQMQNRGEIHALDIDDDRLAELKKRARRAGAHNVRTRRLPPDPHAAETVLSDLLGRADRVLVDAPCSGTGTYRRKPDARYRLTPAQIEAHRVRQIQLLSQFARLVKPGGRLIYGTCSILSDENESVVEAFLAENAGFSKMAIESILGDVLAHKVTRGGYLRLSSHEHGTDGFFGAVLRRG